MSQDENINTPEIEDVVADTTDQSASDAKWYDNADTDMKSYLENKGWDDPIKAVSSYQELEKEFGKVKRMKAPEAPEQYEVLKVPTDDPELARFKDVDLSQDEVFQSFYQDTFKNLNLTQDQVDGIVSAYLKAEAKTAMQIEEGLDKEKAKLGKDADIILEEVGLFIKNTYEEEDQAVLATLAETAQGVKFLQKLMKSGKIPGDETNEPADTRTLSELEELTSKARAAYNKVPTESNKQALSKHRSEWIALRDKLNSKK